tara:strand:+ start:9218 stop:10000 length:783 start_codon:yes stop_codon:yes gene_type:complete
MIIEPGFLDHWKTQMLISALEDGGAAIYVIRLWEHCQQRRMWRFAFTPQMVRGICRYQGDDAAAILDALVETGFVDQLDDGMYEVHDFFEHNAKMCRNWTRNPHGRAGKPKKNPKRTQAEPKEPGGVTHKEAIGLDWIGVDGVDGITHSPDGGRVTMRDFEPWYDRYPKKKGKDAAKKAWKQKLKDMPSLAILIEVLEAQKASEDWVRDSGQFVPYPATYLRAGSYQDIIEPTIDAELEAHLKTVASGELPSLPEGYIPK